MDTFKTVSCRTLYFSILILKIHYQPSQMTCHTHHICRSFHELLIVIETSPYIPLLQFRLQLQQIEFLSHRLYIQYGVIVTLERREYEFIIFLLSLILTIINLSNVITADLSINRNLNLSLRSDLDYFLGEIRNNPVLMPDESVFSFGFFY